MKLLNKLRHLINVECLHEWRYNFPSIPNKRICIHCKERQELNLHTLVWTEKFEDKRSDQELIKIWV